MKVLFILLRFRKDGLATNVLDLTKGLIDKGHEVHLITAGFSNTSILNQEDTYFKRLEDDFESWGVKVHNFVDPYGGTIKRGILNVVMLLKMVYYVLSIRADIIHCHSPMTTFVPWLLRKKSVTTVHTDTIRPNFWYKHPNLVIAVSQGSKDFTEQVMHTPPETVRIVHHGISMRFSEPIPKNELNKIRTAHHIPKDKLIVGCVGRITPGKGQGVVIEAITKFLSPDIAENIHMVFVGNCDSEKNLKWINGLITDNDIEERITILPFQDPKPWYQIFDLFILASTIDTFGLVAVEAMLSGCCILRSSSFGAKDQVEHGKSGFIFEMDNAEELASFIEKVFCDDVLRERLALAGKKRVLENFTVEKMVDKTVKVYKELI